MPITVTINGAKETLAHTLTTVADLLSAPPYEGKLVAVAINGAFIPRSDYTTTALKDGQTLEIVAPMQGG